MPAACIPVPEPAAHPVPAQIGGLLAFAGQDPDQHDPPFGRRDRLLPLVVAFDRREARDVKKFEKLPGLADPLVRACRWSEL